jgi:hypothetical protein
MNKTRAMKITIVLAILVAFVAAAAFLNVYYVADGAGATLYWRADDAYLFVGASSSGYHFRYLDYPMVALREYFNAPLRPDDNHVSGMVIHVTPLVVERNQLDYGKYGAATPHFLTPFNDGFYAMCKGQVLCKLIGDHFEPATEEQRVTHDGTSRLFHGDMSGQLVNGWSVREVRRSPGDHFEIQVGNQYGIHAENHAKDVRYPWVSAELLRPGKSSETLYNVNGTPRRVSRTEYEKLFGGS